MSESIEFAEAVEVNDLCFRAVKKGDIGRDRAINVVPQPSDHHQYYIRAIAVSDTSTPSSPEAIVTFTNSKRLKAPIGRFPILTSGINTGVMLMCSRQGGREAFTLVLNRRLHKYFDEIMNIRE